jgi:hypothetical protein
MKGRVDKSMGMTSLRCSFFSFDFKMCEIEGCCMKGTGGRKKKKDERPPVCARHLP